MQVQLSSQVLYNLKSTNVMVSFLIRHLRLSVSRIHCIDGGNADAPLIIVC